MYEIYTTPGFILSARTQGDSDMYLRVYTKDLGLIGVIVSGARKESSKHRYSIQPYSFVSMSVVSGKRGFRMTGVEHLNHGSIGKSLWSKNIVSNVSLLVETFIHGQEPDPDLFTIIETLFLHLETYHSDQGIQEIDPMSDPYEIYIVVRILDQLGYFDRSHIVLEDFFTQLLPPTHVIEYVTDNKHGLVSYINTAIHESQF